MGTLHPSPFGVVEALWVQAAPATQTRAEVTRPHRAEIISVTTVEALGVEKGVTLEDPQAMVLPPQEMEASQEEMGTRIIPEIMEAAASPGEETVVSQEEMETLMTPVIMEAVASQAEETVVSSEVLISQVTVTCK